MNGGDDRALDEGASDRQIAAPNQTWPTRVVLSTYGFGAALNEESLKNLKYCLDWLRFLNAHLGKLVSALKSVVEELDDHRRSQMDEDRHANGGIARALPASYENSRAVLAAKVESLKGDVVATMKKVVEVVSNYTGSALPENARELIKRHIFALPQRFQAANASELVEKEKDGPMSSASRALVLAKEGLDMMQQVSAVVEGTIDRAEEWCERLGRKKREDDGQSSGEEKKIEWAEGGRDGNGDVKMEKP
ncbi:transcription factor Opi1-domain-containing protein [Tuber brumale]|nr:transcription factor Opi1-domain-containing protein [Tuber brumale]